ncbi:ATP-binding protein [uncultured Acetobacterium sp.]|uniref:sensor histidine kinase n=1 Tax=uncultured Acetobacterium sp. TaxID=217139 RepID=UPI0025E6AD4E|nr:ATP-binding protein [uncultured Acetobacterium sp.]
MKHSLRTKFSLTFALVLLLTIGLISLLSNFFIEKQFTNYLAVQQDKRTLEIADNLSQQYDSVAKTWDADFVHTIGMYALNDGYLISVMDAEGQIIWDAQTCDMSLCEQVTDEINQRMTMLRRAREGEFTEKSLSLIKNNEIIGTVQISYYGPYFLNEDDFQFLKSLNTILIGIGLFSLFFSFILGTFLAKRLSSPILKTVSVAKEISDGDYAVRIKESSNTKELDELIITINHLADSLGKQEALRKQLTADVAHELRTPLTSVGTHIEAMIEGVWEPTTERLKSCHDEILRIGKIIQDLESLAKVESENIKLQKSKINIVEAIDKALYSLAAEIKKKNLDVVTTGMGSDIEADLNRITQVLINLISNAVKYTPEGGAIEVSLSESDTDQKIQIKDNGIGIGEEDLPFIFERFYRADKSRNRMTGGTGIGLAIVKSIVSAHGGTVEVESRLSEGSCFTITLPK